MTDEPSFEDRWLAALTLVEVRGWGVSYNVTGQTINVSIPLDADGVGHFTQTFDKIPECLQVLLDLLRDGPPRPYKYGWTDPRGVYGTIT